MRFVLVPGAGGLASYWSFVVPRLVAAGHEARPVDLLEIEVVPGGHLNALSHPQELAVALLRGR